METGFKRLAILACLVLFGIGTVFGVVHWTNISRSWRRAILQPSGDPIVYVVDSQDLTHEQYHRYTRTKYPTSEAIFARLQRSVERDEASEAESTDVPPQVAYVYWPQAAGSTAQLYSREEYLKAEARDDVPAPLRQVVSTLRGRQQFPGPAQVPTMGRAVLLSFGIFATTVAPWVFFLAMRWVIRGFGRNADGDGGNLAAT